MNEQKNLILAVALVVAILFGFNYFYERPRSLERQQQIELMQKQAEQAQAQTGQSTQTSTLKESTPLGRDEAVSVSKRIAIQTPKFKGSIALQGGVIDDLQLLDYTQTPDEKSPKVILLSPHQTREGYFGGFRWKHVSVEGQSQHPLPNGDDVWQASSDVLSVSKPLTLTYTNGSGLIFERTIAVDEHYMFTVTDKVINKTKDTLTLKHNAHIERHDIPVSSQSGFILHEGPIGVIDTKLYEIDYEDMKLQPKPRETQFENAQKSWIGFTDKYWLTALIPDPAHPASYAFTGDHDKKIYQVTAEGQALTLKPGEEKAAVVHFYAGAKVLSLLDGYEKTIGFDKFDLAVDFGWFYFLTKPLFYVLQFLHSWLGNFGLAILLLTIFVKIIFFPLANKSYRSMSRMRMLAPQIEALKLRYGDDRMKMNQAMMELYQKQKINPMSGCLPMLIQAPVFFCLYKVLYVSLDMRHAPFYGWVHDLSAPDPTSILNLFGLLPFAAPSFLQIGLWPIIMGLTMFLQQKMNPQPADKTQAMMFMFMPIFLIFVFAGFPAGLVIYWAWSNVLGILQQWLIMRLEEQRALAQKVNFKK